MAVLVTDDSPLGFFAYSVGHELQDHVQKQQRGEIIQVGRAFRPPGGGSFPAKQRLLQAFAVIPLSRQDVGTASRGSCRHLEQGRGDWGGKKGVCGAAASCFSACMTGTAQCRPASSRSSRALTAKLWAYRELVQVVTKEWKPYFRSLSDPCAVRGNCVVRCLCRSEDAQGNPIGILSAALCAGHNQQETG